MYVPGASLSSVPETLRRRGHGSTGEMVKTLEEGWKLHLHGDWWSVS